MKSNNGNDMGAMDDRELRKAMDNSIQGIAFNPDVAVKRRRDY
ncbi:unnamed protein product [marine sediment metagenome]|uniref:Uncharacterized protein n=1 Tax=marine sediment metagenome TaxID=412755 RepID=X1TJ33_9ZZZZ